jgi:hypothetical protein
VIALGQIHLGRVDIADVFRREESCVAYVDSSAGYLTPIILGAVVYFDTPFVAL